MRSKPISENQITLSIGQSAEVLGVNPSTITRLIAKGKLPKVQLTEWRVGVLRTDLKRYVMANRKKAAANGDKKSCNKAIDVAKSPRVKAATTANTQS
jgi:excisionase family DNA binding protein